MHRAALVKIPLFFLVVAVSFGIVSFVLIFFDSSYNFLIAICSGFIYLTCIPSYLALSKDSPVTLRLDKIMRKDYLDKSPNLVGRWNVNDASSFQQGNMNREYAALLEAGATNKLAIRWVQAYYLTESGGYWNIGLNIIPFFRSGMEPEDFTRFWNLGYSDVKLMLDMIEVANKNDIDDSLFIAIS